MKVVIDRFESDYAIVELPDRSMEMLPRRLLGPTAAKEMSWRSGGCPEKRAGAPGDRHPGEGTMG